MSLVKKFIILMNLRAESKQAENWNKEVLHCLYQQCKTQLPSEIFVNLVISKMHWIKIKTGSFSLTWQLRIVSSWNWWLLFQRRGTYKIRGKVLFLSDRKPEVSVSYALKLDQNSLRPLIKAWTSLLSASAPLLIDISTTEIQYHTTKIHLVQNTTSVQPKH